MREKLGDTLVLDKKAKSWLIPILLWAVSAYIWILPLFRPHGIYGWGHFRLLDICLGVPLGLAAVCVTVYAIGPRQHRTALRLASIFVSTLLTVIVLDLVYAAGFQGAFRTPVRTDFWFDGTSISRDDNIPDDELGFTRKPGVFWQGRVSPESRMVTYRTDEKGFRNENGIHQADIVFVGDSFTEGASVPVEDTFVQQVGKKTKRSVVNLGCGYYGAQQELIILRRYGLGYSPRVVVWQLFEGNDIGDAQRFADWQRNPIKSESVLQQYIKHSLITRWLGRTLVQGVVTPRRIQYRDGTAGPVSLDYHYSPDEPAQVPLGFAETKNALEAGYRLCQSRGIKLVVVFVPIKVRILGPYVLFDSQSDKDNYLPAGIGASEKDFGHEIAKFCGQLGCPFIDLTAALQKRAAEDNHYVYMTGPDSHLDVDGHRVVADTLAEWLQSNSANSSASRVDIPGGK